jgi:hypothetical protein
MVSLALRAATILTRLLNLQEYGLRPWMSTLLSAFEWILAKSTEVSQFLAFGVIGM